MTTRILRLANIQFNTFSEYVETLCNSGLLEKLSHQTSDNRVKYVYKATDKGREWCKEVNLVYNLLENPA